MFSVAFFQFFYYISQAKGCLAYLQKLRMEYEGDRARLQPNPNGVLVCEYVCVCVYVDARVWVWWWCWCWWWWWCVCESVCVCVCEGGRGGVWGDTNRAGSTYMCVCEYLLFAIS